MEQTIYYYSFGRRSLLDDKKIYYIDCKLPATCPRDAVAFYNTLYSKIPCWNSKRLNKKFFEYPLQDWVATFLKRVYVFELVAKKGKTIQQYKLINEFDISEILDKFPTHY
jgi:hypothetical protein